VFSINLKRSLASFAVVAALLATAGPASAVVTDNKDPEVMKHHRALVAADFNYREAFMDYTDDWLID
jgi:hypothetical protein